MTFEYGISIDIYTLKMYRRSKLFLFFHFLFQKGSPISAALLIYYLYLYTAKEVPQPQVLEALGFLKVNPLEFNPSCQSISMPIR